MVFILRVGLTKAPPLKEDCSQDPSTSPPRWAQVSTESRLLALPG